MLDLKRLSDDELESLRHDIDAEFQKRIDVIPDPEEFTFEFEETGDTRKAKPYVALLTGLDEEGKIQREFKHFNRSWGNKAVTIFGSYTARNGDLLEIQTGGSWKNNYRYWHIVVNGELKKLGHYQDSYAGMQVKKYLGKKITLEELINA